MTQRFLAGCLALLAALSFAAPARPAGPVREYIGTVPDTGQFLADTVILARVNDRAIRVRSFIESYYDSYAEFRPYPDSAGRVEFLRTMVNKEMLGLIARSLNRPLGFEDRIKLREHTETVLSNVLFQRVVADSVTVTEDEIRDIYRQFAYKQHLRHILLDTRALAEKVRFDLRNGRVGWKDAVRRYSRATNDPGPDGDLGWISRSEVEPRTGIAVFRLQPGEISVPLQDRNGYHLMQCVERQNIDPPAYEPLHNNLRDQIRELEEAERSERLMAMLRARVGMTYDTANIAFASAQFQTPVGVRHDEAGAVLEIQHDVPEFTPQDTGRVLARTRNGLFTLGEFLRQYQIAAPMLRANVSDPELFRGQLDGMVLQPTMAQMAVERGLDKDSLAVRLIERKREQILVEHLYDDSVASRVWVPPDERRKYYQANISKYMTWPNVRFAAFSRHGRLSADSVAARLRAGEKAEDLLRADSLRGLVSGSILERRGDEHGPYQKLLFEELRPGKVTVEGPDKAGDFVILQLLSYDAGRQLSYEEAQQYVDESLQNLKAEELFNAFLARWRPRFKIESHPEKVMLIRLVDPTLD